jgi:hypothetical protein
MGWGQLFGSCSTVAPRFPWLSINIARPSGTALLKINDLIFFSGLYQTSSEGVLVALTATEFPAGPSVSTRFAACHIEWFPTRFPKVPRVRRIRGSEAVPGSPETHFESSQFSFSSRPLACTT